MRLSELVKKCALSLKDMPLKDCEISSISSDSRSVRAGCLFIAVKGHESEGHDFISHALRNGAAAIIAEKNDSRLDNVILVKNSREAMASIAADFYGNPSREMTLVGVTGTNGKTTITFLIESIFKACGYATGVIGTVNIRFNDQIVDNPVTTPDSIDLQKTLYDMKTAGITHVVMEVSSHGLALNRVDNCFFDVGIFSNLTQDHLDFHDNIESYFQCKKRFFTDFLGHRDGRLSPAVLNIDDSKGMQLHQELDYKTFSLGIDTSADIQADDISDTIEGLSATIHYPEGFFKISSSLTGRFNLENILCAAGAALALDVEPQFIQQGLESCVNIPGRLEKIPNQLDRYIFVDYAHTPNALDSILRTLKEHSPKRLITVFGCGGDRDRKKRSVMGQIACQKSNITIITSDNPRTEDPEFIINDIVKGLTDFQSLLPATLAVSPFKKGFIIEQDRKQAIEKAVRLSKPGDIIVVAGKGHENYQITKSGTIHFDDREELESACRKIEEQFKPIPWKPADLTDALDCDPLINNIDPGHTFDGISIDSRTMTSKEVFLALKGETFDGHTFIADLARKGIKGFIAENAFFNSLDNDVRKAFLLRDLLFIETPDTLSALGKLARYQRLRADVKVLAITGSSGKTTTRNIITRIFNTRYHTLSTKRNFNNEIGLPLTLLSLSNAHEWAVVEMGMNHAGEISRLTQYAMPDMAMVTNVTEVHLEGLGTTDNVANAKAEIFEGIRNKGIAIINGGDSRRDILETHARKNKKVHSILFFGDAPDTSFNAFDIATRNGSTLFSSKIKDQTVNLSIRSPAHFMVNNCLAAITAANSAGIDPECISAGIRSFNPMTGRMHIYKLSQNVHLIDDTYNANPASVSNALKTLHRISHGNLSIAALGDMLELGAQSDKLHYEIGKKISTLDIDYLFVFGKQGKHIIAGAVENGFSEYSTYHGDKEAIAEQIFQLLNKKTWILVKGSRGMAMEHVIQALKKLTAGQA